MLLSLRSHGISSAAKNVFCNGNLWSSKTAALHTEQNKEHFDIIICGGGLVGATLACALKKDSVLSGKRLLVLERAPAFKGFDSKGQFGKRVSALNKGSVELFKSLGMWHQMEVTGRIKSVKQMQVWDASSDALIHFQHANFSEDVACIIENDLMLDAAHSVLSKSEGIEVKNNSRVEKLQTAADNSSSPKVSTVALKDGTEYSCDLLIGADGPNSSVRKAMNVDVYTLNYESRCVVANLDLQDAGDNAVAWQRFLPTGPIALLPLSDNTSSLVWSTTNEHARELLSLSPEDFVSAVNEAFFKTYPRNDLLLKALHSMNAVMGRSSGDLLRQYPPKVIKLLDKTRGAFPLGFLHASSYVCSGAALIGDAAHRIHPLAGQGLNLGFSDVQFLTETLSECAYNGAKLGDVKQLTKYEQKCLTKNVPIMVGVHALHSMYSTTFSPIVFLRSLGLQFTENIPLIKNIFMRRAMG